jgi:thiol-disulfide isomerase/thioredoxin
MSKKLFFLLASLLVLIQAWNTSEAQSSARREPASAEEQAKLRAAVEASPNDLKAHEAYIKSLNYWSPEDKVWILDPTLEKQYNEWLKKFPASVAVPYAIGHAYTVTEDDKGEPYLLRAVEIDPKFLLAYNDLILIASLRGDEKQKMHYIQKAREAAPDNGKYAYQYAASFQRTDFPKYRELLLQVADDFPNDEMGATSLSVLALTTTNIGEKIELSERIKKEFLAGKLRGLSGFNALTRYYHTLLEFSPGKAFALAQSVLTVAGKDEKYKEYQKQWATNVSTAKVIIQACSLLDQGKAAEASNMLENLSLPVYSSAKEWFLLQKAKALDAAGRTAEAYSRVLTAYAKEPTAVLYYNLHDFGRRLGKNSDKIKQEVSYTRDTAARQAPNFTLMNYITKKQVSLSDLSGKVVLLTYWFPGCGPCHGEFPHFENVVKKFKGRDDFAYVSINTAPEQARYVFPHIQAFGLSFIPLEDKKGWDKGPIDNKRRAPVNFIIDEKGKVIFSEFRIDETNEETLEMMIRSLLEKKKA